MKIPQSQEEAQDVVLEYLQKTVDGLPPGTILDSSDSQGASNLSCDDNYTGPGTGPSNFSVAIHVVGDAAHPPTDLITLTGELWQSWGWQVTERAGFEKPNRFAAAPDGYRLQIVAAYPHTYPPTLAVISPCFPGDLRNDHLPFPRIVRQTPRP